ncbi:MAG: acyl-CoA dehydrogenase family protein [Leptolyngbyaceae bacterium]|nr:acyl-CoA dehydrogenase family protein [Leptolyngbyaceae bacterium]
MIESFISQSEFLQTVHDWLLEQVAPQSMQLDTEPDALLNAFKGLGEQGWLALRAPHKKSGTTVDSATYFGFQFLLARYSGALAFLQTQHQSAAGFIAGGTNSHLKATYLSAMATGQHRVGIGYSHLRRPVSPLHAVPDSDGYRVTGDIPWVTGEGFFEECVIAATLPSGDVILGVIPLVEHFSSESETRDSLQQGSLVISDPMPLMVMDVTHTVRVALNHWFIPARHVVDIKSANWLPMRDRQNVLKAASFALGCAQAGLDLITDAIDRKGWRSLTPYRNQLQQAVDTCFTSCIQRLGQSSLAEPEVEYRRQLRAQAVDLAGRCAQGAIATVGGASNLLHHPAQRVYREALMFTVTGQTPDVAQAILAQLANREP